MKTLKLKPCPFCGSDYINIQNTCIAVAHSYVFCCDCGASGPPEEGEITEIELWNTRAEPSTSLIAAAPEMLDVLIRALHILDVYKVKGKLNGDIEAVIAKATGQTP